MDAKQTPLIELLERVPHNARCRVDEPDGMGSVFIPVGRLCHEAATALRKRQTQPVQEPVAWMVYTLDGKSVCVTDNPNDFSEEHRALALYTIPPRPEQDDEPATCWKCGEDGGTSCGVEACGLIEAQPEQEQEPVAWIYAPTVGDGPKERRLTFVPPHEWGTQLCIDIVPLCTTQQPRQWVGLTEEEIKILWIQYRAALPRYLCFGRAIEAKLKEKNT